jgi:hypothetical protein
MKRFRLLVAVLMLGLGAGAIGLAAGSAPAFAATHAQATTVSSSTGTPADDIYCPYYDNHFAVFQSGCINRQSTSCQPHSTLFTYPDIAYASNDCPYRVWLYEFDGAGAYNLCMNPYSKTHALGRSYTYFWVSDNTSDCT